MTEFKKDILNEPDQLAKCLAHTLGPGRAALAEAATLLATAPHLAIAGIGSSWHAGMAIAGIFQAAGRPACLFDASELLHFAELPKGSAVVVLSRSGRSTEIVKLLDKLGACGCRVIGITNTPDSPLGRKAAVTLRLDAEFDHMVSVAMYSGLALVGGLLAAAAVNSVDGSLGDLVLSLPAVPAAWQFVIDIVPAQLAAEKLSHMRGVSCDDFRLCPYIVEEEGGLL